MKRVGLSAFALLVVAAQASHGVSAQMPVYPGTAAGAGAKYSLSAPGQKGPAPSKGSNQSITYLGTVNFTCTNFTAAGTGAAILDRDNTGTGNEQVRLDVTDGNGTIIYTLTFSNGLGSYSGGLIVTTPYTTAPLFNPITLIMTSLAGNGLPQVVSFPGQGSCVGLPIGVPTLPKTVLFTLAAMLTAAAAWMLRRRSALR